MFSKRCEYAIRAVLHIAHQSAHGQRINLKSLSEAIDSPEPFTAKILQDLSRQNLIKSVKGPYGGFEMSEDQMQQVTLSQVVALMDGDQVYLGCGLGLKECSDENPCPLHSYFKAIRISLKEMLEATPVSALAKKLDGENAILKV